jgi:hypothetical protein
MSFVDLKENEWRQSIGNRLTRSGFASQILRIEADTSKSHRAKLPNRAHYRNSESDVADLAAVAESNAYRSGPKAHLQLLFKNWSYYLSLCSSHFLTPINVSGSHPN